MGEGFFRSRAASEALGVLLLLTGVLTLLALFSYDPRDPNLFSLTTGAAESPTNWIGGFGASLAAALYQTLGFAAWTVPVALAFWGVRRFASRPFENRSSKAVGFALLFLAVPALISLAFGRRALAGEEAESGGIVGRAVSDAARARLGTTGAVLLVLTLILIAVPLATQVSLADVFFGLRVRLAGLLSRFRLGWARTRDRRTKERLRRSGRRPPRRRSRNCRSRSRATPIRRSRCSRSAREPEPLTGASSPRPAA